MSLSAPPPIHTARLTVRVVEERDLPALFAFNSDDEVTRFLPYATWQSMEDAQAWYRRMMGMQEAGGTLQFVIVDRARDTPVGSCLLFKHDQPSARAELGYVLSRAYWGGGIMQEALTGLIDHAFGPIALRRLEAEINPRNTASARVLQRLGFVQESLLRQRWMSKGALADSGLYGLLREDWQAGAAR
jgi:[ribosomal protein S5]-alanine N-acetyltransferase